ncbi:MAG: hypothetical protein ABS81_00535 [Pseudonocardia sp. SCN 72-86]|nr:MAG: hypothetical protein ABS81_00535 [Pseudonocardia sp. SCN 72-86]
MPCAALQGSPTVLIRSRTTASVGATSAPNRYVEPRTGEGGRGVRRRQAVAGGDVELVAPRGRDERVEVEAVQPRGVAAQDGALVLVGELRDRAEQAVPVELLRGEG